MRLTTSHCKNHVRSERWEDDIRMELEEIGINTGNWVDSAHDRDY